MSERNSTLTDKEAMETQSGFMVVLKAADGRLVLSLRRKVGTPPTSQVYFTSDEVRQLTALMGEVLPQSVSERHLVGAKREEASAPASDLEIFMSQEYPTLARRKKSKNNFDPAAFLNTRVKLVAAVVLLVCIIWLAFGLFTGKKESAPDQAAVSAPQTGNLALNIEREAERFVKCLLDFKQDTYRSSQIKAMSMMSAELQKKYWQETGFPLSQEQQRRLPKEQEIRIESSLARKSGPGLHVVDVRGGIVTRETAADASKSMPMHIQLTMLEDQSGRLTVIEQKDLSAQASQEGASQAESGKEP